MSYTNKDTQRAYQREWIKRRRAEWFKLNGPCVDCGSWIKLELDHVDWRQKITHKIWSFSQKKRDLELAKCVVRCKICHNKKTVIDDGRAYKSFKYSKLTEENVRAIRMSKGSISAVELAIKFKIHKRSIYRLWNNEKWKFLGQIEK